MSSLLWHFPSIVCMHASQSAKQWEDVRTRLAEITHTHNTNIRHHQTYITSLYLGGFHRLDI